MPAVVEEVVSGGRGSGLLPGAQTVGSIACGEGGAEAYEAIFSVPGERSIGAAPVVGGRIALPVVRGAGGELVVVVVGERIGTKAQRRQVVGSIGSMREVIGDEQVVVAAAVCRASGNLTGQTILIGRALTLLIA